MLKKLAIHVSNYRLFFFEHLNKGPVPEHVCQTTLFQEVSKC